MSMKQMYILSLLLLTTLFVKGQSTDSIALVKVMNMQIERWNKGDVDGFMDGYWKSDSLTFVTHKGVKRGWTAMRDGYKKSYPTREAMGNLIFDHLEVKVLNATTAYVIGRWSVDEKQPDKQGWFTLLFRKFPEGWRIVSDHTD